MSICRTSPPTALAALCVAAAMLPATALAAKPPAGRLLASNCYQCHGTNGRGPGFDDIAGKSARELYKDLKEFQSGEEGDGLMAAHARGYTDAQLMAIARYLARQR
ncbi:c-type cytochrome [Rubrivivax albus]|uniref:C-type cytochrome n=1 Tax=Rubrivivax albus TaxID=2499835 RepID=A0A3S2U843_9BURK|nr:c-type cytochrome [Rubrivivax albus]RVT50839.1 c-type cytochrome [Rubrivivax albus]